ncbi:hypothetical protein PENSUB_8955 [Penicillium subrubescens]|uniref:Uncharacterized protein n=1 Tax=Penicillium subrubescens TaxID=1316194 RepID=A0A1Q5TEQ0_9EURO|nr:hypothetical protein PENSUB_8955 [Penicillium subrubescens]
MTLQFVRYLRKQFPSIQVSVEIEKPGRPGLQELAEEADVVFYAKTWAQDGACALERGTEDFKHVAAYTTENFQVVE